MTALEREEKQPEENDNTRGKKSSSWIYGDCFWGRLWQNWSWRRQSPLVRESKTVLHSGFHAVDSGFQVLDSSVLSGTWILDSNSECMELRIPWAQLQIPKPRFPDFPGKIFPGFRIPQVKISRISESRFLYLGRHHGFYPYFILRKHWSNSVGQVSGSSANV